MKLKNAKSLHMSFGNHLSRNLTIITLMGILFCFTEVIFRVLDYPVPTGLIDMTVMSPFALVGYTSLWMFPVGGLSGFFIGLMNQYAAPKYFPYQLQVFCGGLIITALELISGLILNVGFGFHLWDYSTYPLNFMGQICLPATLLWIVMTPFAMWVDDVLRHYLAGAPKPEPLWRYYADIFRKAQQ
jgi:hypothetical protein